MSVSAFAHGTIASAGVSGGLVDLVSFNETHFTVSPTTATAGVRLLNTGAQQSRQGVVYTTENTWLNSGAAGDYQVFCTVNSGGLSSGTTGSWLALSTSREWNVSSTGGFLEASITLEIRLAVSPFTVLASSTHAFSVEMAI